ncbi:hypothetical protein [Pseudomonas sp. EA_35y_Pfl2_R5]|uniref:hypothetical protein n=1 Tax=Pseudomonas sp. EA_35y_Pfl2_R5 TaxID=3088690 RepID=UPI0030DD8BDA
MERRHIPLFLIFFACSANAEVSDKIASVSNMWTVALLSGLVASALTLWKKWFLLLGVAFSALYLSATIDLASDQSLAKAIIAEQGSLYFPQSYITSLIPLLMVVASYLYVRKQNRSAAPN